MKKIILLFSALLAFATLANAQNSIPDPAVSLGKIKGATTTVEELRNNHRLELHSGITSVERFEVSLLFINKNGEERYFGPFTVKWSQNLPDNIYALIDESPSELKKIFVEGIRVRDSSGTQRLCNAIILTCNK